MFYQKHDHIRLFDADTRNMPPIAENYVLLLGTSVNFLGLLDLRINCLACQG